MYILIEKFNFNTLSLGNCITAINGDYDFCYCNMCSENEGHCDSHDDCQDSLLCGSNNCPSSLGFDSEVDCCYKPTEVCADSNGDFIWTAASCKDCSTEFCNGAACYWNFDLEECQNKGNCFFPTALD